MAALPSACRWLRHICVEVLQGYVCPWQLAHKWPVGHLGVRTRRVRLHAEGAMRVGAQLAKVDRRSASWPVLCNTRTAQRFRQARRGLGVVNEPMHCVTASLCQSLLAAIPPGACARMAQRCGRYAQARCLSVNECTEPLRPDASAGEELRCPFLATVGDLVGGATGRLWRKAGVEARQKD